MVRGREGGRARLVTADKAGAKATVALFGARPLVKEGGREGRKEQRASRLFVVGGGGKKEEESEVGVSGEEGVVGVVEGSRGLGPEPMALWLLKL
jgi:hypothetical protein